MKKSSSRRKLCPNLWLIGFGVAFDPKSYALNKGVFMVSRYRVLLSMDVLQTTTLERIAWSAWYSGNLLRGWSIFFFGLELKPTWIWKSFWAMHHRVHVWVLGSALDPSGYTVSDHVVRLLERQKILVQNVHLSDICHGFWLQPESFSGQCSSEDFCCPGSRQDW